MADATSYPTDDMSSTSKSLTSFIDEQWGQHSALFLNNHDSFVALLQAVAKVIPDAGGKVEELVSHLQNCHQQYQSCYQALHGLAQHIDTAAQTMSSEDQNVGNSFQ